MKTPAVRTDEDWSLACTARSDWIATMSTDGFPYIEAEIGERLLEVLTVASAAYAPNMTGMEEAGLIREIIDGRRELFADLIGPHLIPLLHIVRRTTGRHPDVEDIVQQAVIKALTHLDQFRFEASFRTWLIRIGLNEARQWQRKYAASRFVAVDLPTLTQLRAADESRSPLVECQR